jgi:hypothetical protein
MAQHTRVPGEEKIDPKTGLPPVLNNANEDVNEIGRKRERVLAATAMAATGGEGEIAPPPPIDDGPAERVAQFAGKDVRVRISPTRRDPMSAKFGPESKLPKGTQVNKDGTVYEGAEGQPYGVIGDIETPQGWLINRIIPLESLNTDEKAA